MAAPTDKPADKSATASEAKPEQPTQQKLAAALEEDDEFEDFPVEGLFAIPSPVSRRLLPSRSRPQQVLQGVFPLIAQS